MKEQILQQILGEVQKVNHRLDNVENSLGNLESSLGNLENRLGNLENRLGNLENSFGDLENRFGDLENRFGDLENRLENLENRLDGFEKEANHRFDLLEKGQEKLLAGQEQLKDNIVNGLGPYFERIEKHIDTQIEELQDDFDAQQRVIDALASRSIKHESEIRDFKRMLKNQ